MSFVSLLAQPQLASAAQIHQENPENQDAAAIMGERMYARNIEEWK